ncbi:uncharacterized protein DUF4974 [Dyadobacter jejuensis]|uniref:Uncharacterized protein DUF4974 n=1 Tax=Dyadobacter jejuensis TaxID=1082580 RepID=A0A316ALP6_9BACT|nr:FecR family protein [Dyadobacter jejuensis]PWJ57750.1 uncharacterized protein DUF4974 [Dyadobacter jejuensis]
MKDYLNYNVEDLAQDDFFILWVLSTNISAETFWQNWLERHPYKRNDLEAARKLVLKATDLPTPDLSEERIHSIKESVFSRIERLENPSGPRLSWGFRSYWSMAAAVAGILLVAGWYMQKEQALSPMELSPFATAVVEEITTKEVNNESQRAMLVNLPDGSSVTLSKGSRLTYPSQFGADSREITLSGEAFFEVAKDPQKPFYVFAQRLTTKVLGTSFNVRAYQDDDEVSVSVKTGRVSVFQAEGTEAQKPKGGTELEGLVLHPDQEARFVNKEIKLVALPAKREPKAVDIPEELRQMDFDYVETPITEIFKELEKAYQVRFVYDYTVMSKCPITAQLTGEPFQKKLHLLCKAVGAKYSEQNGIITITGDGCE